MLTDFDIQHIKETRKEITKNRVEDILLGKRVVIGESPLTGDKTYAPVTETVQGTWKTLYSQSGGEGEIQYRDGAIIDLDIEIDIEGLERVTRVLTGEQYVVKATDILGLGDPNRHHILLELIK